MSLERAAHYRDLIVWQRAMDLVDHIYAQTSGWPTDERYGLSSQVGRAAVSIPANIAEGHGRKGPREFSHHLSIAHGSLSEAETLVLIASRQRFIPESKLNELLGSAAEVGRLINGLLRSLNKNAANSAT